MLSRILLLLASIFLVPHQVFASSQTSPLYWLEDSKALSLAIGTTWVKLGHYEKDLTSESGYVSAIQSDSFFLSPDGRHNPDKELIATIKAMYQAPGKDPDRHPQCQFPARFIWLKQQLGKDNAPPAVSCPEFRNWTDDHSVESISIVYATGYLGNPASFYGHTFLKFNSANGGSEFLDKTINYGAVVPDGENPVTYIFKGIFGGYIGGFSEVSYYFHNNNYGENELRDLWEYSLNLKQESVELIVAHAWEVIKKEYTYFFFRKNCAYRMAELVEIVEGVNVIRPHLVTMPQALIKSFMASSVDGAPLVQEVRYHPSRQTKLYEKYLALSDQEKQLVHEIVDNPNTLDSPEFQTLSVSSKQLIIDALLDYLNFVRAPEERAADITTPFYRRVLVERYKLPPGVAEVDRWPGSPPHEGRNPSLVQISTTYNTENAEGMVFTLRPAYYDVLDGDNSHVRDSALTMGLIEINASRGNGTDLRRLTFVEIESINAAVTGLPQDNGSGWRLKVGLESKDLACTSCLILRGEAYYGHSRRLSEDVLIGGYIGGQLQENHQNSGHTNAVVTIFSNLFTGSDISARISVDAIQPLDGEKGSQINAALLTRYQLGQNTDIRFSYHKDKAEEFALSLGFYF